MIEPAESVEGSEIIEAKGVWKELKITSKIIRFYLRMLSQRDKHSVTELVEGAENPHSITTNNNPDLSIDDILLFSGPLSVSISKLAPRTPILYKN